MSGYLINNKILLNIAKAICKQTGYTTIPVSRMAEYINQIQNIARAKETEIINRTISGYYENKQVQMISAYTFMGCSQLSAASFPDAFFTGNYAFADCISMSYINVPNLYYIGNNSFLNCSSLTFISLPKVSTIYSLAFMNCRSLMSLYITTSTVPELSYSNAFTGTPLIDPELTGSFGSIFVKASLVSAFKTDTKWKWSFYSNRIVGI